MVAVKIAEQSGMASLNGASVAFPQVCTHELFEQQVGRSPDATAVIFGSEQIAYREINERANRLARHLRSRGIGPDVLVGVCLDRSPALVVALLAVWKAGGAYVPLDPGYPADRLGFMVSDSNARLILTEDRFARLFDTVEDRMICLDRDEARFGSESAADLAPASRPSDLAYVMYTSGSTGRPKGAMITHRGLVNYLWWAIGAYGVEAGRSVPVHSSVSFDLTVTALYPALLAGGSIELLGEEAGARHLHAALSRAGDRTLVKITPAHLELLNQQIDRAQAAGITRLFVIGGENLLAENLRPWRDLVPHTRLINEYGPTETVVGCCVHEVQPGDPHTGSVPIGRPIANTSLYILDESGDGVPTGEIGELFIGGAGVARGYLNRPELNRERFPLDPFSPDAGARMYKTGDLVRCRGDGILEYHGRSDDQVKIGGYRIELGEIEAALLASPTLKSVTVIAREDEPGVKHLAAYVVMSDDAQFEPDALRDFLAQKLPAHMLPAHFVALPTLPLTANGKVDRNRLPVPGMVDAGSGRGGPARTPTEQAVSRIWRDLLKRDNIGIDDDFFDIGGRSMTATALVGRLHAAFQVDFRLSSLFEQPTIAGIAEIIDMQLVTRRQADAGPAEQREEFVL